MAIIGHCVKALERIATDPAASQPYCLLEKRGDFEDPYADPVHRERVASHESEDSIPEHAWAEFSGESGSDPEHSAPPAKPKATDSARLANLPEVWNHLPEEVPRRLRERLLVMARRAQEARQHFQVETNGELWKF